MKHGIQIVLLFSVLFGLSNCKKSENDILYNKKYIREIKAARKDLGYYLSSNFIPGASIAVMKDGELIYSEGLGFASKDLAVPVKRSTKFRIGNTSELFTNVIYQKLVEEEILHPDSSVSYYYPEFSGKQYKVTLNDLVQQMSGIREPSVNEINRQSFNLTLEKGLEQIISEPLETPPGLYQTRGYFNYNILGAVMKKATQMSYSKLLEKYVTDTLNLSHTVVDNPFITIENRSNFFDQNYIAQIVNQTTIDLRHRAPADGLLSNAEDLAKLGNMIINSNYLSEKTKENLWKSTPLYNGIPSQMANAWMLLVDYDGRKLYGKAGSVSGGGSSLVVYPEENLVVAYTCNLTTKTDNTPVFSIVKYFLPGGLEENTKKDAEK